MKKSILSLSAAVALGGLGFAGSANAWVAFDTAGTAANALVDHAAGTGHMLFTPYYTANSGLATLVNIVNTDSQNGKAVKVRFRGASNSDDVLDFTLFLSPGDVWSGAVIQDAATGVASLSTSDKSCTIPAASAWAGGVPFNPQRLPDYVSADVRAALTREGYVEVLNMADIEKGSALYKATKHVSGVAPCDTLDYNGLLSTTNDVSAARSYGLGNPTGGLMGTWSVLNLGDMGTFSGNQSALLATNGTAGNPYNGIWNGSPANMVFFPQTEAAVGADVTPYTADPLLTGASPIIAPLWFDLPDMSTPLTPSFGGTAAGQAVNLSLAFAKQSIMNEYVATAAGADVPFNTDWVVSQPTRRYHAAVNYGADAAHSAIVWNGAQSDNLYKDLTLDKTNAYGPQACMKLSFSSTDREEKEVKEVSSGAFSPGSAPVVKPYCGEVFVAQFGAASTLHAAITNRAVAPIGEAGWASLGYTGTNLGPINAGLPMVGYAATLFQNSAAGTTFGQTFPHRYTGSLRLP